MQAKLAAFRFFIRSESESLRPLSFLLLAAFRLLLLGEKFKNIFPAPGKSRQKKGSFRSLKGRPRPAMFCWPTRASLPAIYQSGH